MLFRKEGFFTYKNVTIVLIYFGMADVQREKEDHMKKIIRKLTAVCLALILTGINCTGYVESVRAAESELVLTGTLEIGQDGYRVNQGEVLEHSGIYEITTSGNAANGRLQIQSGKHEIVLNRVNLDLTGEDSQNSPVYVKSGCEVIFYLKGESSIKVKGDIAGIYVEEGAKAEFRAWETESAKRGILTVKAESGAAIGGNAKGGAGRVEIHSGEYDLFSKNGAAIGGGSEAAIDNEIIIYGGEIKASSTYGAAIGSGVESDFNGNIEIHGGNIKANEGRDIPKGGNGGKGGNEYNTLGRQGDSGEDGFGGIGAGGGKGGSKGGAGIHKNPPGNGRAGKDGGNMNGKISVFGGVIETSVIGGGNAGSGGGGGSTGYPGEDEEETAGLSSTGGNGGNGGNGGDNGGTIEIYGGEIKAPIIGGGNGGNGGGVGGIWYMEVGLEHVDGGLGGTSGYTYSGDGADGERVFLDRDYTAGAAGLGGAGGKIIINGGEIRSAVKIGGYEAEIERNAGRIYEEEGYQSYDCEALNPHLSTEKVMAEIKLPDNMAVTGAAFISKPFEMKTAINADGTLTFWLEEGRYDFWFTVAETSFYANDIDVFSEMPTVMANASGYIDLSRFSAKIEQEGYYDGSGNFIPFTNSEDKPYMISGESSENGLRVTEAGKYYFNLDDVNAGSKDVPFLILENEPEIYITGQGILNGVKGSGTVRIEGEAYEIRDIDASVIIMDKQGNLRYGAKLLTPWKNTEVTVSYNGNVTTSRTDEEGALYPLMLKGEEQTVKIEYGLASLEGQIRVEGSSWNSQSPVNEYDCNDWELSLDITKASVGIVKNEQGCEILCGDAESFIYTGNKTVKIDGKGEDTDNPIYIEGDGAEVIFKNISLKTKGTKSPVTIGGNTLAKVLLEGENYIFSASGAAGIRIPVSSTLIFGGEGSITVIGGSKAGGIGGAFGESSGSLVIKDGALVHVMGNLGNADGKSTFDIGPDCREVIVENNGLKADYISGVIKDGEGRSLIKDFYVFAEDFKNTEIAYSLNKTAYFTTQIGSENGLYLYSAKEEPLSRLWLIKEGYCYLCGISAENEIRIDYDNPLSPEFPQNMVKGEIVKKKGERIELGACASPSVPKSEIVYKWFYKAAAGDDYEMLPESGAVCVISSFMPTHQGYYKVEATESNGQSAFAEFILKMWEAGGGTGGTSGGSSGGSTGGSSGGSGGGGAGGSSGGSSGGGGGGSSGGASGGGAGGAGSGTGAAGGLTAGGIGTTIQLISVANLIRLDGIVTYDTEKLNTVKLWHTYKGIIKSAEKIEIYDKGEWKTQVQVNEELKSKKEDDEGVCFIGGYTLKVRNIETKQEYMICIDEVVVDPMAPVITLEGRKLSINKKDSVSYKKTFKNKLTIKIETDYSFSNKDGLYYKVVKKGKNVDSVRWKKVRRNNKVSVNKPMEACIYIKAVDKLGKETTVRTQGFRIVSE